MRELWKKESLGLKVGDWVFWRDDDIRLQLHETASVSEYGAIWLRLKQAVIRHKDKCRALNACSQT